MRNVYKIFVGNRQGMRPLCLISSNT